MEISHITNILNEINNLIENNYFTGEEEIVIDLYNLELKKDKNFLKNLGKYKKIKKDDDLILNHVKCPICLEEFKQNEYKRVLPLCNHVFHKRCIDKWLMENSKECPVCRCNHEKYSTNS